MEQYQGGAQIRTLAILAIKSNLEFFSQSLKLKEDPQGFASPNCYFL